MSNPRSHASVPSLPDLPPRYRMIRRLGHTSWTNTLLAFDTQTPDRPQCVIRQWVLNDSRDISVDPVRQALLLEVAIGKQLEFHPQVPQIRDCFEIGQCVYTIRDYIPGHGFSSLHHPHRWSELESLRVLRATLTILAIAHQGGIVHGNLHPKNLILHSTDSRVVLTDFRSRCLIPGPPLPRQSPEGGALPIERTPYIAPEQLRGQSCPGSDLYALGRIMTERLTGLKLWQYPRETELADLLQRSPKPLSARLREILIQMTAQSPADRFPSAVETLRALDAESSACPLPLSLFTPERSPSTA